MPLAAPASAASSTRFVFYLRMSRCLRDRRVGPAPISDLPRAHGRRFYDGPQHNGDRLVELHWHPSQPYNGGFLDPWLSAADRAASQVGAVLTLFDDRGRWVPQSIATDSAGLPGEWAYYLARPRAGGDLMAVAKDGALLCRAPPGSARMQAALAAVPDDGRAYLYELTSTGGNVCLFDGQRCRFGGPMRSNDPRGLGLRANCRLMEDGRFLLLPSADVPVLRPDMPSADRRRAELVWDYGVEYWQHPAHAALL